MNYLRHLYKRHLPEYIFKCTGHFVHLVNSLLPPTPKSSNTSEKNTSILWAWLSYWSWRSSIATTHMGERSFRRGLRLNDLSNSKEWKHQCIQGRRYPLCLFTCKIIAPSTSIIKTPVATTSQLIRTLSPNVCFTSSGPRRRPWRQSSTGSGTRLAPWPHPLSREAWNHSFLPGQQGVAACGHQEQLWQGERLKGGRARRKKSWRWEVLMTMAVTLDPWSLTIDLKIYVLSL